MQAHFMVNSEDVKSPTSRVACPQAGKSTYHHKVKSGTFHPYLVD